MARNKRVKDAKILRNKIKFVSKIAKMQKTLREESENIIKIKVQRLILEYVWGQVTQRTTT